MTKYYTTSEVAKLCNVHRNTIIGAIRKGLLKIHRTPGGHARIAQDDLDDFCHRRSLPTTSLISRNNRILLVEDGAQHVSVLAQGLRDSGYLVEIAGDSFGAGFLLAKFQPNLLLASIAKAGDLGDEVSRKVRALPRHRDLSTIALVTHRDADAQRLALSAGVDDVLSRPVELDELLQRIVRQIGPVVSGTSGRAVSEATRRIERSSFSDDKATRKATPRDGLTTSTGGVLSGQDADEGVL
ncbi:MAG: excisionase family DNA-binding protein [Planctomycetes bacterium]|nr:excisionase family DNA-binding protein [Planctomycetota bacterium]